tara:strand:- start:164 stop:361 length:198 start_codon:yes stop_codon:yes gene_type:complete
MKVEITKRQLQAIQEVCTTIDATLGASDNEGLGGVIGASDFDTEMNRELKIIKTFFKKNGYKLDV